MFVIIIFNLKVIVISIVVNSPFAAQPTHAQKMYSVCFAEPVLRPLFFTFSHQPEQFVAHETADGRVGRIKAHLRPKRKRNVLYALY